MKLCIYEDAYEELYPLTYLRPVFELRCGHTLLREKIERVLGPADGCFVRDALAAAWAEKLPCTVNDASLLSGDDLMLVNGRAVFIGLSLEREGPEEIAMSGDEVVCARLKAATLEQLGARTVADILAAAAKSLPTRKVDVRVAKFPWDLVFANAAAIEDDFRVLGPTRKNGKFADGAYVYGDESQLHIADSAEIHPTVVLDTTHGPIILDEGVVVYPHTRVEGPASVGRDSFLVGGKIREETSIGPVCRVGGEVEASIIHGYSNKYHDGFLGHAYVGEWVNLGALTTNSDLKNDYSTVSVYIKGKLTDSESMKTGAFIGDHTKTGIGTFFNTGTVVGVMCNLLGSGKPLPKFLPSFCWYFNEMIAKGTGLRSLIETARAAMARRDIELTAADEELLRYTHEITKEERDKLIKRDRRKLRVRR